MPSFNYIPIRRYLLYPLNSAIFELPTHRLSPPVRMIRVAVNGLKGQNAASPGHRPGYEYRRK